MNRRATLHWVKYLLLSVIVIGIAIVDIQSAPDQHKQVITHASMVTDKSQSANSALTSDDKALPQKEETTVAVDEHSQPVAASLEDGKSVPLTKDQLSDFEAKLYASQTQKEYEATMSTLQYYDKGVDLSRFSWYWDSLKDIYSKQQIEMMKSGKYEWKKVPYVVGMKAGDAFKLMTDSGVLARVSYYYNPNSDLPADYCYSQDIATGTTIRTDACVMLTMQTPKELAGVLINWNPDDVDFDINAIAQKIRDTGTYSIYMPDVVGLPGDEAKSKLEAEGFENVTICYVRTDDSIATGLCFNQRFDPGMLITNTYPFEIKVQADPPAMHVVPNVVGMWEGDAVAAISAAGLSAWCYHADSGQSNIEAGTCFKQDWEPGSSTQQTNMFIYIQYDDPISVTPQPTDCAQDTPQPTASPTPTEAA